MPFNNFFFLFMSTFYFKQQKQNVFDITASDTQIWHFGFFTVLWLVKSGSC